MLGNTSPILPKLMTLETRQKRAGGSTTYSSVRMASGHWNKTVNKSF